MVQVLDSHYICLSVTILGLDFIVPRYSLHLCQNSLTNIVRVSCTGKTVIKILIENLGPYYARYIRCRKLSFIVRKGTSTHNF